MMDNIRKSGVLLHITSLPNKFGWGKFSRECYGFIDLLSVGGFSVWEILPVSPTMFGNSPYSAVSSFAINPIFLDVSSYLPQADLQGLTQCSNLDEYTRRFKDVLKMVCDNWRGKFDLSQFEKENGYWLKDYAMYVSIKNKYDLPWYLFPKNLKDRKKEALQKFFIENRQEIEDIILIQYLLDKDYKKIKEYANSKGVEIFGDTPFYVERDSVDVWANPSGWQIGKGDNLVAGVPPDYFNKDGQLWGYPIYDYEYLKKHNYSYFEKKFKRLSQLFDVIRIDHFVAINKYYAVKAGSKNAKHGKWKLGAGEELLKVIVKATSGKIVAEDLGIVTDSVKTLKDKFEIPGVKVLQFGFDSDNDSEHKPHNYEKNCVAYLGTHDNDTFMGVLSEGNWDKINRFKRYFDMPLEWGNEAVVDKAIKCLCRSSANLVIFTMQDLLKLGKSARMNTPGVPSGNWEWKLDGFNDDVFKNFAEINKIYAR